MSETGWHRHQTQGVVRDADCQCSHGVRNVPPPVLVVPLDGLEETIARVLRENALSDKPAEFDSDIHSWRCRYPDRYGPCSCFQGLVGALVQALHGAGDETRGNGWAPDTCTTPHCICRRGHPNSHVIADTRSDGTPWEDTNP